MQDSRVWAVLAVVVVGIVLMTTGAALLGLLVGLAGLAWGVFDRQAVEASRRDLTKWNRSKICLACPHVFP
ncbi:hypothetical protein [Streptomyces sp. NPDC046805]|uniref:hypothetical protein n=1 Tax=Streptomyces sp. NPDC046805 TaxID=3155134 RepID=UPI0033E169ED